MKKVTIVLLAILLCFSFSACRSLRISSIDDLIAPVSPSGEDADILAAVDDYCKGGYSIKIPSTGNYTTSFIIHDLDGDGKDEAIAFFEPADTIGVVNMTVLTKGITSWHVVGSIAGDGTDVNCVDFSDVNNDGQEEIIVCWSKLSNSVTSNLCIYCVGSDFMPVLTVDSITACDFVSVDINDDGENELLVFNFASTVSSPKAELFKINGESRSLIGETKLDSTIASIKNITCSKTDEGTSVFVDAMRSNGDSMVTELLYYSNYYNSVISPFYSYSSGRTKETTRSNTILCSDIDDDGEIEIPLDRSAPGLPNEITAQNWVSYNNTVLNHKAYSLACKKDKYVLRLSDEIISQMTVAYDESARELLIGDGTNDLIRLRTVIKSSYSSDDYSSYTQIFSDSGFVYLAIVNESVDGNITIDELKNSIKPY